MLHSLRLSVLILFTVMGCSTQQPNNQFPINPELPAMERRSLVHDGIEREYFVFVPPALKESGAAAPVLIHLHGYTSTATGYQAYHGSNRHAAKAGYIAVYPQGSHFMAGAGDRAFQITSWNDLAGNLTIPGGRPHCSTEFTPAPCPPECGSCSRCAWTSCYDDAGFLKQVIGDVDKYYNTQPRRRYLLGVSNGAMMALRLACLAPEDFGAVVAVIAQLAPGFACAPKQDLPLLHLAGGRDNTVRPDGGLGGGYYYESIARTTEVWGDAMDCAAPAVWANNLTRERSLNCEARQNCRIKGQDVISCIDPDETHRFPGQRVEGVPATCVTSEQSNSMPETADCPTAGGRRYEGWGMEFAWDFLSRYQRTE